MGGAQRYPSIVMDAALDDGFRFRSTHPTRRHAFAFPRREAPEVMRSAMPSKTKRAQGKPGALSTRDRAHKMHTGDRKVRRNTRPSLRNGFTAYSALSPATNSSCHRR